MPGQSILRLFLPRIVAGFLLGALYAGALYGSPVSGSLAGALCAASFISLRVRQENFLTETTLHKVVTVTIAGAIARLLTRH